ncbi:glucosaminidase domain-containing protein, partial [Proteiniclasticum sp. SCR006]
KPATLGEVSIEGVPVLDIEKEIRATAESETLTLYQFWVKDLSTNLWTMIQDYSEKNTAKWTPEKTGEYLYGVHVKDSLSQASFDAYQYNPITIRLPKPATFESLVLYGNDSISSIKRIEAKAISETTALYQFWVKDLSTNLWTMIQGYSEENSAIWIPKYKGSYLYGVHVRSKGSENEYDEYKYNHIEMFGEYVYNNSYYLIDFEAALNEQMKKNPQKIVNSVQVAATREEVEYQMNPNNFIPFVDTTNNLLKSRVQINTDSLNVRKGPSSTEQVIAVVGKNEMFDLLDKVDGWYKIKIGLNEGWISASYVILLGDKKNVPILDTGMYQFIVLSGTSGISEANLNSELVGKGVLQNQAESFIAASLKCNINELYLIAHSRLETGNGTSELSNGVLVTSVNGEPVEPRIVYNMYGIGAVDGDALKKGSETAYTNGWFSIESAIIGGADWISRQYINNKYYMQNTLYKMRWNPANPSGWHQYATDIEWATKQNKIMTSLVNAASKYNVTLSFDLPVYR